MGIKSRQTEVPNADQSKSSDDPRQEFASEILNDLHCCLSPEDLELGPRQPHIPGHCPDCGCGVGEVHSIGCHIERCSICHDQIDECGGCKDHDRRLSAWSAAASEPVPNYTPKIRSLGINKRKTRPVKSAESLIRYPGGKQGMIEPILSRLIPMLEESGPDAEYREPFLGGGSVAIAILQIHRGRRAWLNDGDPSLATLWDEVIHRPDPIKMMIEEFDRVLDERYFFFYQRVLKSIHTPADLAPHDPTWIALIKLATQLMSFSGLGTRAGGPMGGKNQWRPQSIRSRYNPDRLRATIDEFQTILSATRLREGTCTCLPFERLFEPGEAVIYLDPPYYQAGPDLYQMSFHDEHHARMAGLLKRESRQWLLSYDEHPMIRELYQGWSRIDEVEVGYSINGSRRKVELLISSR